MIVDGINLIDGVIENAAVESGTTLPVDNLDIGRLFYLTQIDGSNNPGLYIHNGVDWETSGETGDITDIVAGSGLTGGGNSGSVQLEIDAAVVATITITDNLNTTKLNKSGDTMSGNLDLGTNKIVALGAPTLGADATTKTYVDNVVGGIDLSTKVNKAGDTMTGNLIFSTGDISFTPVGSGLDWSAIGLSVRGDVAGGVIIDSTTLEAHHQFAVQGINQVEIDNSSLTMVNNADLVLAHDPTTSLEAATKQYVDSGVSGVDLSSRVAKTGDTMTGDLILTNVGGQNILHINHTNPLLRVGTPAGQLEILTNTIQATGDIIMAPSLTTIGSFHSGGLNIDTGFNLTLGQDPTLNLQAATKQYVDTGIGGVDLSSRVAKAGDSMTGDLSMGTNNVDITGTGSAGVGGALSFSGSGVGGTKMFANTTAGGLTFESVAVAGIFEYQFNNVPKMMVSNDGAKLLNSGKLELAQDPVALLEAATKQYVDTEVGGIDLSVKLDKTGDTMTGALILDADPVALLGAATKQYVDSVASGLDIKASVRVATTSNLTLSGTQTVDGVSLIVSDRVLVKNQTAGEENGIYDVAVGAWVRSDDADNTPANEVTSGMFTFIDEGSVNANTGWTLSTADPITLDVTVLVFAQFSGAGQIIAGTGMTKSGDTINVIGGTGITANADDVALDLTFADARYIQQAENAASATKLNTARDIAVGGDLSGNASFDGTANVTITATVDNVGSYTNDRTSNKTLVNLETVFVNTTSGILTMTLPGSPTLGDQVTIIDQKGTFSTFKCIVGRNGGVIMSLSQDMDITTDNASVTLIYSNAVDGWRIK